MDPKNKTLITFTCKTMEDFKHLDMLLHSQEYILENPPEFDNIIVTVKETNEKYGYRIEKNNNAYYIVTV